MIPEFLDKHCIVYKHDGLAFLSALAPESVQLIWTHPPYDEDEKKRMGFLKSVAQMEATELCAAVADIAVKILAPNGGLAICLSHQSSIGVVSAVTKRTALQFGGFITDSEDLESTTVVFHKGEPSDDTWTYIGVDEPYSSLTPFIEEYTRPGDIVVDPFCGSGNVMEAAVKAHRIAVMNDHDSEAVQATITRYKERCAQ